MCGGNACGILIDIVILIQMTKCRPGNPGPVSIEFHFGAVTLRKEVCHEGVHILCGHALPTLDPLVDLQLELCQDGHDEEIALEIRECFLEQADLELRIAIGLQQMVPDQRLIEIRSYFCHKQ